MRDVVIVGGGPGGILTSYYFQQNDVESIILERGLIGQSWRNMRPGMILLSPAVPGSDWTSLSLKQPIWAIPGVKRPFPAKDDFICYLEKFVLDNELNFVERCEVFKIKKSNGGYLISSQNGDVKTRFVVIASGSYGRPRFIDLEGITGNSHVIHSSDYFSCMSYYGKKVLVVGGGNSAAEIAIELSGNTRVTLLSKGPLKYFTETLGLADIRGLSESILKELINFKIIEHICDDSLKNLDGGVVTFESGKTRAYDRIIMATGFLPALPAFEKVKVALNGDGLPEISNIGESVTAGGIFFAGSLAMFNIRCKFIHGFRSEVEKVTWGVFDKM